MRRRIILDYFIATPRYARRRHVCSECGRVIDSNEICLTDGDDLMCIECINEWIGRPIEKHDCNGLVEFLEKLNCDACECPEDEDDY